MEAVIDFLVNNYMWFLVMTIILIFALIGYLVEDHELKKSQAYGGVSKEIEQNFERLAAAAQNQTLFDAISKTNGMNQMNSMNQIEPNPNYVMNQPMVNANQSVINNQNQSMNSNINNMNMVSNQMNMQNMNGMGQYPNNNGFQVLNK